jgi:glutamate decarboxylase
LKASREHPPFSLFDASHDPTVHNTVYALDDIPKYSLPPKGLPNTAAYQLIHDEMDLDGAPVLNLASFVTTGMDEYADKLMAENIGKNLIDFDEYPATQEIHTRCISILGDLWKVPKGCHAIGTATTGSSEAVQLGGLAMKKRWQVRFILALDHLPRVSTFIALMGSLFWNIGKDESGRKGYL